MAVASPGSMLALAIAMMIICTTLVTLRFISRRLQKATVKGPSIGKDDILIVFSLLGLLALCIEMIIAVARRRWGYSFYLGTIVQKYPRIVEWSPEYIESIRFQFVHECILPLQLMFAKLSIVFFYRRVLCVERKGFFHYATLATMVITTLWGISMFFLFLFQCGGKVSEDWDPLSINQEEHCLPSLSIVAVMIGFDIFLDLAIILLPIHRLIRLQVSLYKRVLLVGVFATGTLSFIASLLRLYAYLTALHFVDNSLSQMNPNIVISNIMFWGLFEASFAIIAACLPSVRSVFVLAFRTMNEKRRSLGSYTKSGGSESEKYRRKGNLSQISTGSSEQDRDTERGICVTTTFSSEAHV